ncbi:MAG: leucine-rich repeat domain-containing protein [Muribaculaceae bacterium]|nr:leucine-rich repeat domain-containing protein [Muribaculaceae bacterium]
MKRFTTIFTFVVLMAMPSIAHVVEIDNLKYDLTDGAEKVATLIGFADNVSVKNQVEPPAIIQSDGESYTLTGIKEEAFINDETLQVIILPKTITSIGDRAFKNCKNLKSVRIDSKELEIGEETFYGAGDSFAFNLGSSCKNFTIKDRAFANSGINDLYVSADEWRLGDAVFQSSGIKYVFMDCILETGKDTFKDCKELVYFEKSPVENGWSRIEDGFFDGCSNLRYLRLDKSTKEIGRHAFSSAFRIIEFVYDVIPSFSKDSFENEDDWKKVGVALFCFDEDVALNPEYSLLFEDKYYTTFETDGIYEFLPLYDIDDTHYGSYEFLPGLNLEKRNTVCYFPANSRWILAADKEGGDWRSEVFVNDKEIAQTIINGWVSYIIDIEGKTEIRVEYSNSGVDTIEGISADCDVYTTDGVCIGKLSGAEYHGLPQGVYILRDSKGQSKKIVVK